MPFLRSIGRRCFLFSEGHFLFRQVHSFDFPADRQPRFGRRMALAVAPPTFVNVGGVGQVVAEDFLEELERKRHEARILRPSDEELAEWGVLASRGSGHEPPLGAPQANWLALLVADEAVPAVQLPAPVASGKNIVRVRDPAKRAFILNHSHNTGTKPLHSPQRSTQR